MMAFLDEVKDSVETVIKPDKESGSNKVKAKLKEDWHEVLSEAKDTYQASKKTARDCVSSNPWKTVAISVLAGWVIGKFAKFNFNSSFNS
jgi:ElaB/YqjD/DUF883 family membrane-anchored ribosome-binding protein